MHFDQKTSIALSVLALTVVLGASPVRAAHGSHGGGALHATGNPPHHGQSQSVHHHRSLEQTSNPSVPMPSATLPAATTALPPATPSLTPMRSSAPAAQSAAPLPPIQVTQPAPGFDPVTASTGGSARTNPTPGGGGATLPECMALWDRSTHMTRAEWRETCQRTLNGLELPTGDGALGAKTGKRTTRR